MNNDSHQLLARHFQAATALQPIRRKATSSLAVPQGVAMSDEDETDQVSIEETDEVEVEEEEAQEEPTEQQEEEQEPPEAQAEQEAQEAQEEEQEAQHEEQQAEQQEDQQEEEEEEEQEATEVPNDDSPIEWGKLKSHHLNYSPEIPSGICRLLEMLKGLQSDTSMNGRVGYIRGRENVEDGGRFIVELGTRGIARVREANLEKAKAAPKGAKGPSKATQKVAVKKGSGLSEKLLEVSAMVQHQSLRGAHARQGIKAARAAKEKTSGATIAFAPTHASRNYKDQHIVIWYGGNESAPKSLAGEVSQALARRRSDGENRGPEAIFKGQPGQLLDSDGEFLGCTRDSVCAAQHESQANSNQKEANALTRRVRADACNALSATCLPRGARGEAPVVSEGAFSLYCTAKFTFALAASQDAECATSVGCTWLCVAKYLQHEAAALPAKVLQEIQAQCWPILSAGHDLIGIAKSGRKSVLYTDSPESLSSMSVEALALQL
ncbi:hypothetical protein AK812_SmicGene20807 [Symbiodinium microadriaticum]|uniref:Uncharacterized protein n=1 Tax=Symbiodinium microadriaticum TaxID=2951 RepID=A0A1Q9DP19_SYMMI|nr:hypothetical protein AK812_SmicGene20807 [Symbiodinium microadriaticum]